MRYSLYVNQKQALSLGLNINQALILQLIGEAHSWATPQIIDDEVYYWTARQKIADELTILNLKSDTIYRHIKSLAEKGLIDYKKVGKKDCIKLTEKGKNYYVGNESEKEQNSEIDSTKLGNESENNSEMNPTYNNTNIINIQDNKTLLTASLKEADEVSKYLKQKIMNYQPDHKPIDETKWVKDIELAIRVDKRTKEQLIACIDWVYSTKGNFWIPNIMSGKKLRDKFDQMQIQSRRTNGTTSALNDKIDESMQMYSELKGQGLL
jgi:DNA-binding MarR family transcriptional regulator